MAPLSLFRGQGGTTPVASTSAATVAVDALPERPRTPPNPNPNPLRRTSSGSNEPVPSPSRLNPARLLRRKGSRSIRDGRDGTAPSREDPGLFSRQGPNSSASTSLGADKWFGRHRSGSGSTSATGDQPQLRPSPTIHGLAHFAGSPPSSATSPTLSHSHSREGSVGSATAANLNSSNFGSVRSLGSVRSDGSAGDTEVILGPSPDHPLIQGDASVLHHHPFLLPSGPPPTYPTPLSPPRRKARSPIPPPPRHAASQDPQRSDTPSSGSAPWDVGDRSEAPTVTPQRSVELEAEVPDPERSRADTAAWLARTPSGRRPFMASVTADRRRGDGTRDRAERERAGYALEPSISRASASDDSVDAPLTPTVSPRAGPATPTHPPMSTVSAPQPQSQIQQATQSQSQTQSQVQPASQPPAPPRTPDRTGYVVSVHCVPSDDEVRWEVILRRPRDGPSGSAPAPTLPPGGAVRLAPSTHESQVVQAPPFASSVNLSLALDTDTPSGKLVFITLPDSTPARVRSRSSSSMGASPRPAARHIRDPNTPTTSSASASTSGSATYAHIGSPPRGTGMSMGMVGGNLGGGIRESVFGVFGDTIPPSESPPRNTLGSPAPLTAKPHSTPPPLSTAEPLSPRSAAYKRQGAVWAPGGLSPLSAEGDVFTSSRDFPSPRAAAAAAAARQG